MRLLKELNENYLTHFQKEQIKEFCAHSSWKKKDTSILFAAGQVDTLTLWSRIHNRLLEMKDIRKKKIKDKLIARLVPGPELDTKFNEIVLKKHEVVRNFTE